MIKVIKRMFVASICTFSLLMVAAIPVLAINVEPAAIEEITWKKVCSLETYGSVTVTLKLNYNATTQTSTLKSCTYTTNLDKLQYPLLKVTKVSPNPSVGKTVNPSSGVKVTIYYDPLPSQIPDLSKEFTISSTTVG